HLREPNGLARGLGAGAGEHGDAAVDVGDRRGDHLLLLALVEGVELAVGAEDEDAVDAVGEEVVEEPLQARQVEVPVVVHRGGEGGDDAVDAHGGSRGREGSGWVRRRRGGAAAGDYTAAAPRGPRAGTIARGQRSEVRGQKSEVS